MKRRSGGWPPWLLVLMLAVLWMADANADPATRDMGPTYAADDCVMEIHEHMARIVCADSADNAWIKWDPAAGRYMSGTGSNEVRPQNWFDPNETGALSSFFVASSGSDPDPCPFPNANVRSGVVRSVVGRGLSRPGGCPRHRVDRFGCAAWR